MKSLLYLSLIKHKLYECILNFVVYLLFALSLLRTQTETEQLVATLNKQN